MAALKKYIQYILFVGLLAGIRPCAADITLAVIAPKAGEHAKAGNELFNGAKLAVQEINDNGGLNGEKLDVLTIDDRCDDRLAVSTAEMLTLLSSKKIGLVVGPYCSNRFNDVAAKYEKAKIFQIVPTTVSYNAGNTEKKGQILLLGTKSQISEDFFQYYNQNFAGLKVGFVYNDKPEDGYAEVAKTLFDEFRRYGKSDLLKFYVLNNKHTPMAELATTVVKDKVNIVFVLGKDKETINFIEEIKNADKNQIIFTDKRKISPQILQSLGKKANGLYLLDIPRLKDSLAFTENLVNLRLLGIEPEGMETYSYVAVKLWGDLVQEVHSFSYEKLAQAANTGEMKEKWSDFLMHSGSVKASKYVIEIYQDGEFKQVY
ncbi:MAG: ABC transporter substrate-binding protein [Acetobacter sp.]|nr:ABC transporter substrate-binding protein [Acetobacter sp.]